MFLNKLLNLSVRLLSCLAGLQAALRESFNYL